MTAGGHIDTDAARRLLATLEADAPRARNRADGSGDARDLARVVELALFSVPAGRVFADAGARRELAAFDAPLARALKTWFQAPFAREAALRTAVFAARGTWIKQDVSIGALMRSYRAFDESTRRGARAELDRLFGTLYSSTGVQEIIKQHQRTVPPPSPAPAIPATAPASPSSLLILPSAELIQGLSGGSPLDPAMLAALATPPPAVSSVAPAASPVDAQKEDLALRDLLRAIAESILGTAPATFGAWRAACAALHVADFRTAPLELLGRPSLRTLPFEHPAVPLTRAGAIVDQDADAWSTSTALFGLGREVAGDAFAGALLATTATKSFATRALSDRPGDPTKAARAFALSCGFRYAASRFHEHTDAESLRAAYDETFRASPPAELAAWWCLESRLASAPGEDAAIYAHTAALSTAILRGVGLAATLRDQFDEDWFKNPRLTRDRLRDLAAIAEPAPEARLITWLREHVRL